MNPFSDRSFCSGLFVWIQKQHLLPPGARVLLAVSGGLDSMLMLDFFKRFGSTKYQVYWGVAHLDHALRPESARDADWLQDFCQQRQILYWQHRLVANASRSQTSLEALMREQRYQWLLHICHQQGFSHLATAHTASDQAEGIVMRLIRGGVAGLGGIRPVSPRGSITLIRPLLNVSRTEIRAYAAEHGLIWREDSSNQDTLFFRNRLRAEVLPRLRQEHPQLEQHLNTHALIWQAEQDLLADLAREKLRELAVIKPEQLALALKPFRQLHPALQRLVLKQALMTLAEDWKIFSSRHIEALRELSLAGRGKQLDLPRAIRAVRQGENLVLYRSSQTWQSAGPFQSPS